MKNVTPHMNGSYTTDTGSIINRHTGCIIEEPAILLDTETGTALKAGEAEYVTRYLSKAYDAYKRVGSNPSYLQIITFDKYKHLTIDQICALLNYLQNHLEEKQVSNLLSMNKNDLIAKLNKLYEIGW